MRKLGFLPVLLVLSGCYNVDEGLYALDLSLDISIDPVFSDTGRLHLQAHHAWFGEAELRHPLGLIEAWEGGELSASHAVIEHTLLVPLGLGEGLAVFGFMDVDGDGVHCAVGQDGEPSGIVVTTELDGHSLALDLLLDSACLGPEALHPR